MNDWQRRNSPSRFGAEVRRARVRVVGCRLLWASVAWASSLWASVALAEGSLDRVTPLDTRADGAYGRFQHDVTFTLGAALELSPGGPAPSLRGLAHYFWMAGVYAAFSRPSASPATDRVFAAGVDFRPAFIPRWTLGRQTGPSTLDLSLDSLSLSMGAYFASPEGGRFGDELGLELGLGGGVPLGGSALGPWLDARALWRGRDGASSGEWVTQLGVHWCFGWLSPLVQ